MAEKPVRKNIGKLWTRSCTQPECKWPALVLSSPARCPAHLEDFERWITRVEKERDRDLQSLAREQYVVICEEHAPVSGMFYHKLAGEPPPNISYRLDDALTFIALAAASGVIGNLAYDGLKRIVLRLLGEEKESLFDEHLSIGMYEEVRTLIHRESERRDEGTAKVVEHEVQLKHRLIIERRRKGRLSK